MWDLYIQGRAIYKKCCKGATAVINSISGGMLFENSIQMNFQNGVPMIYE